MSKVLYFLTGPTGVGKTAVALEWAKKNDAEILSCDSLLFYRGLDIGSAKPSREEQKEVLHHGIDVEAVDRQFNIAQYVDLAKGVVASVEGRGKKLLIVGGSGFYLKSFLAPVVDAVEVPEEVNRAVLQLFEEKGLAGVRAELLRINPRGVGELDVCNPRRVIKALVRCRASGKDLLDLKRSFEEQAVPFMEYEKKICVLERSPELLKERIRRRVLEMVASGLVQEVEGLLSQGIENNPSAANAIGYRETIHWIKSGNANINELVEAIVLNTNKLVAKQRKWFRTQLGQVKRVGTVDTRWVNLDECLGDGDFFS